MDTTGTTTTPTSKAIRVTVVTGANRGLGFSLCRILAQENWPGVTYLTARTLENATSAVASLQKEFPDSESTFLPIKLEMTNAEDRENLVNLISSKYGHIDHLVQNAGIYPREFNEDNAKQTILVNFVSVMELNKLCLPLLEAAGEYKVAKITHVSSGLGHFAPCSKDRQTWLRNPETTYAQCLAAFDEFVVSVAKGDDSHQSQLGWPLKDAYRVSKCLLNTGVIHFSADHSWLVPGHKAPENARPIKMVALCPNWCKTNLGSDAAWKTAEFGGQCIRNGMKSDLNGIFLQDGVNEQPF